ncbi:MAG: F0F1 ATP synthase subunit epsilon [Prevotella sp.]|nr:F0F1 ATP synthase subunit epsilon [Prevotella sp.]
MLKLKIVSPEKILYEGDATSVKVPGVLGGMEILQNHAPLISALTAGKVEYIFIFFCICFDMSYFMK